MARGLDAPGADVRGGVPGVAEARDLDDVARVWGVDELAVADVQADVAEPVEEDEVARLELVARHRCAVAVLRSGIVGQRDAELRVHEHHEPGAVEARRWACAAPHVRDAEVLERDRDGARVVRGRKVRVVYRVGDVVGGDRLRRHSLLRRSRRSLLRLEPRPCLGRELCLALLLLRLELDDLVLHGGEQLLLLGDLALDRALLRGTFGDDLRLSRARVLEVGAPGLDLLAVLLDRVQHLRILVRHAVDRVEPRDDVVEALRAEQDLERRVSVPVDVQVTEAPRDRALRHAEALPSCDEVALVGLQVGIDLRELDVRGRIGIGRLIEAWTAAAGPGP